MEYTKRRMPNLPNTTDRSSIQESEDRPPLSLARFPFPAPLHQTTHASLAGRHSLAAARRPPSTRLPPRSCFPTPPFLIPGSPSGSSAGSPSRTMRLRLGCITGRRPWPYSARPRHPAPLLAVVGHMASLDFTVDPHLG
jgi:hypothetical protein